MTPFYITVLFEGLAFVFCFHAYNLTSASFGRIQSSRFGENYEDQTFSVKSNIGFLCFRTAYGVLTEAGETLYRDFSRGP